MPSIETQKKCIWSLDFDGCLANSRTIQDCSTRQQTSLDLSAKQAALAGLFAKRFFTTSTVEEQPCLISEASEIELQREALITSNKILLDYIAQKQEEEQFNTNCIMNGSNRQCKTIDDNNGRRYPSAISSVFDALPMITNKIPNGVLDHFLLSDVFCNIPEGESWRIHRDRQWNGPIPGCPLEERKILLLYAQMHHAALMSRQRNLNANAEATQLTFCFVDDRKDILDALFNYFSKNNLVPHNMKLVLHHYDGEQVTPFPPITGQAAVDNNFRKTIFAFTHAAGFTIEHGWDFPQIKSYPGDIARVSAAQLEKYKDRVTLPAPEVFDKLKEEARLRNERSDSDSSEHMPLLSPKAVFQHKRAASSSSEMDQSTDSPRIIIT